MKGFFIGIALVIPGLSGSMFAVVVGLYERMVEAISTFRKQLLKNIKFLLPIMIGAVIGILASTKLVLWLCEQFPVMSYGFFIGLVIGVLPFVYKKVSFQKFNFFDAILAILGFAFIMFVSHQGTGGLSDFVAMSQLRTLSDWGVIAFAGFFAISMMMIPGISGAVMLMMVNQYGTIYNSVAKLLDTVMFLLVGKFDQAKQAFSSVIILLPFIIGAVLGVILMAKVLNYLLHKYAHQVYCAVFGIVVAGIWILMELALQGAALNVQNSGSWFGVIVILIVAIIVGVLATLFLDNQEPTDV
ncbi:DUF368 domain-containing protein [Pediococcus ethanolidurans]|uniref:DUF368 domain-containing protein n=1 Tax=Pediococcus ethanolidurans TaxID=319653 RepID=UPI001C1EB9BE|nr:DUF368 domain-containing protein [Pediococcus ethanolidurans]MBU7555639.1 DUF368 domain-containing protein [Pediococcus ethanolidurans]MCV3324435.1 DUF368 domain-containing protein [Pediococcus ethanolidurans]MCV3328359.1 DUF368 domain-containing protein [Pediococcus ethanolidurans]